MKFVKILSAVNIDVKIASVSFENVSAITKINWFQQFLYGKGPSMWITTNSNRSVNGNTHFTFLFFYDSYPNVIGRHAPIAYKSFYM